MNWMEYGLLAVATIYGVNAVGYWLAREWPWVLVYLAYAASNFGLLWAAVAFRAIK
jgi:hypothetical protein